MFLIWDTNLDTTTINMNDKLKRLAKKIVDLLPNADIQQDLYEHFKDLMLSQNEYFQFVSNSNKIKLFFYVWSLKRSNNFEIGDSLLNRISFAHLMTTVGNNHNEICGECGESGYVNCYNCDGIGSIDCDVCDSSGEMECPHCYGSGEIEDGGEMVTCAECAGEGIVSCDECGGDGRMDCNNCTGGQVTCDNCDGNGEVETEELDYDRYYICTWNKEIKDKCELTEGIPRPTMSEYDFDRLRNQYIILTYTDDHANLIKQIIVNEVYCISYNDNPTLLSGTKMNLFWQDPNKDIFEL